MKSSKAILPVPGGPAAGWPAAAAGAAVIVRLAAASEAATASARDAAMARLMSVLLALGGLATCREHRYLAGPQSVRKVLATPVRTACRPEPSPFMTEKYWQHLPSNCR